MTSGLPPIVKLATRLLVDLERAVRRFAWLEDITDQHRRPRCK